MVFGGTHDKANDYLLCPNNHGKEITKEQLAFLGANLSELSMGQIIQFPVLAEKAGLGDHEHCLSCLHYAERYDFVHGRWEFDTWEEQDDYLSGKYKPDDYCVHCKQCEKRRW